MITMNDQEQVPKWVKERLQGAADSFAGKMDPNNKGDIDEAVRAMVEEILTSHQVTLAAAQITAITADLTGRITRAIQNRAEKAQ